MKTLLSIFGILALAGIAFAGAPPMHDTSQHAMVPCNLQTVCIDWDFAQGAHGFAPAICEAGGMAVWAFGSTTYIPATGTVWGTVLNSDYVNNSGDGLISPAFDVTANCYLMEVYHYYDIETNYDGGNVSVDGTVLTPMAGYDGTISTSASFYAYCVDLEEGWHGHANMWMTSCFDLTAYMGSSIQVEFDFGSDSSVTYPGWYLGSVKIGTDMATPVEPSTWGSIKEQFK